MVTVTETWTFVFDETGNMPELKSLLELPALASIPTPPEDEALVTPDAPDALAADAAAGSSATGDGA